MCKENSYHLEYSDYCLHAHCYTYNVSTDMSFSLLHELHVKFVAYTEPRTEPWVDCSNSITHD